MLKWLKLHRFRYTKPGTELRFTDGFNVLLGRNGTGKTTLLDLISMVVRWDFSFLKDEEFDIEYECSSALCLAFVRFENRLKPSSHHSASLGQPLGAQTVRKSRYHPQVSIRLRFQLDGVDQNREYEIEAQGGSVRWRTGEDAGLGNGAIDVFGGSLWALLSDVVSVPDGTVNVPVMLAEFGYQGLWAYRFDESLETFESITADNADRKPRLNGVPAIGLEWNAGGFSGPSTFVPWEYHPEVPTFGQFSANVVLPGSSCLVNLPSLIGIKTMSMSLAVDGGRQAGDGPLWFLSHAEFLFFAPGGRSFNHSHLSYGQKRLLAFLWYLDANREFVVADELVNGMHHDWIRACLDMIGGRQAFLTSQNPLLLDYLPLGSVEQIQKTFIQCRVEIIDDFTQLVWSNLTAEDAADLYADYKVGIQPVGEILRARGLW